MGIPAEKWTLLYEDMKSYMTRVYDGNLTIEEYNVILKEKYEEFILKFSE